MVEKSISYFSEGPALDATHCVVDACECVGMFSQLQK